MVYGCTAVTPYEGRRDDVDEDESQEQRTERALRDAALAALHIDLSDGLTPHVLRTIGKTLDSYAFSMGPERWERRMDALLKAAVAYVDWHPEADPLLFREDCPF